MPSRVTVALFLFVNSLLAAELFDYHNGFWLNLHHFLYEQALNAKESKPVAGGGLSRDWQSAIDYYRTSVIDKDLLFDDGLTAMKTNLAELEKAVSLRDSKLPPDLIDALEKAAPVYRTNWRQQHDKANQAWIAAAKSLLVKHEAGVSATLAKLYATEWPAEPIRVDVTTYAGWAGAYTTLHPNHIVINSSEADYQGLATLEMLFHEASHVIIGRVSDEINVEARKQNKWLPGRRDLWHALLFYTAGEVVKRDVDPSYVPFAYHGGLMANAWPFYKAGLEKEWAPYINGEVTREEAISKLIVSVGIEPKR